MMISSKTKRIPSLTVQYRFLMPIRPIGDDLTLYGNYARKNLTVSYYKHKLLEQLIDWTSYIQESCYVSVAAAALVIYGYSFK